MSEETAGAEMVVFGEALASLNRADVDGFVEYVAPHPDWKAVEEPNPLENREAVRSYTEQWLDHWTDFSLTEEESPQAGDGWLIAVRAKGRSRDGIEIDDRFYLHVVIREGRILRWHEYSDRREALEAAGLSE